MRAYSRPIRAFYGPIISFRLFNAFKIFLVLPSSEGHYKPFKASWCLSKAYIKIWTLSLWIKFHCASNGNRTSVVVPLKKGTTTVEWPENDSHLTPCCIFHVVGYTFFFSLKCHSVKIVLSSKIVSFLIRDD